MRIVFMGTPGFAVPSLDILIRNDCNVISVVTVPDKRKGRGQKLSYSAVKEYALEKSLPLLQPLKLKDPDFISALQELKPDLIIIVAFRILPEEVFTIPVSGSFNLHASLLPKYRGAAPINWAVINGEKETGVTTFFLRKKVDTGNIILQEKIPILEEDDAGTIHDKLSELGAQTVLKTVNRIKEGKVETKDQDDSLATPAPKIFKEDCIINWTEEDGKIYNFIRGLSPYPASFTYLKGKTVKIFKTGKTLLPSAGKPGEILIEDKKLLVNTSGNMLEILRLQLEGKKPVSAPDFINGLAEHTGLAFGK